MAALINWQKSEGQTIPLPFIQALIAGLFSFNLMESNDETNYNGIKLELNTAIGIESEELIKLTAAIQSISAINKNIQLNQTGPEIKLSKFRFGLNVLIAGLNCSQFID